MADMMERNALRSAQMHASQVEGLVDQAMRLSPNVKPVGRVNIAQGSVITCFRVGDVSHVTILSFQVHCQRHVFRQYIHGHLVSQ